MSTFNKLYISNLDYGVSNEDIKELFSEIGDIKSCSINYDRHGRSKGTAEVVFSRRSDAIAAVKKYNNVQLDGKPMKIKIIETYIQAPQPAFKRHDSRKRRREENNTKNFESPDASTSSIIEGPCCSHEGCKRAARGKSRLCIKHGGGKRCTSLGCTEAADGSTEFCKVHGGGMRCAFQGGGVCRKSVHGGTQFCVAHGKRCAAEGCTKSASGSTVYCVAHGGGMTCVVEGCTNRARGRTDRCVGHAGGKRCQIEQCSKRAQGSTGFCKLHGGGKRSSPQLYANFSTQGQQEDSVAAEQGTEEAAAGLAFFRERKRGYFTPRKIDLCSADSTSSIQNISASDGGTSESAIGLFATAKPNEMKIAEDKGDPPHEKSNDEKSGITPSGAPIGSKVHGGGLLSLLRSYGQHK